MILLCGWMCSRWPSWPRRARVRRWFVYGITVWITKIRRRRALLLWLRNSSGNLTLVPADMGSGIRCLGPAHVCGIVYKRQCLSALSRRFCSFVRCPSLIFISERTHAVCVARPARLYTTYLLTVLLHRICWVDTGFPLVQTFYGFSYCNAHRLNHTQLCRIYGLC